MSVVIDTGKLTGVKELNSVLRQSDKQLLKDTQAKVRQAASPMVARARAFTPSEPPLSGWANAGRTGWRQGEVMSGIGVKTGGRRLSSTEWPLLSLQQKNAAGMIYDWAGRAGMRHRKPRSRPYANRPAGHRNTAQGKALIDNIRELSSSGAGKYSRVLFPAFASTRAEVVRSMVAAIELTAKKINADIGRI